MGCFKRDRTDREGTAAFCRWTTAGIAGLEPGKGKLVNNMEGSSPALAIHTASSQSS